MRLAADAGGGSRSSRWLPLVGVALILITIDGLWALSPGNDKTAGPATTVFFSAGPNDEQDGLFGALTAVSNPQGSHQ